MTLNRSKKNMGKGRRLFTKTIRCSETFHKLKMKFDQWIMETFDITYEEFIKLIFEDE